MELQILRVNSEAKLPEYATPQSAGLDLRACMDAAMVLGPGEIAVIPTGISIALPPGYEAQVRSRSGLAAKYGVAVLNSPGTIDADYRGEIKVILVNHHKTNGFSVFPGDRIAQLVVAPVTTVVPIEVRELDSTERGQGGLGSTGIS
jgi:dUTP pyrophosphatase